MISCPGTSTAPATTSCPTASPGGNCSKVGGGIRNGNELKMWIPGGASTLVHPEEHLDLEITKGAAAGAGSMLGSGG